MDVILNKLLLVAVEFFDIWNNLNQKILGLCWIIEGNILDLFLDGIPVLFESAFLFVCHLKCIEPTILVFIYALVHNFHNDLRLEL